MNYQEAEKRRIKIMQQYRKERKPAIILIIVGIVIWPLLIVGIIKLNNAKKAPLTFAATVKRDLIATAINEMDMFSSLEYYEWEELSLDKLLAAGLVKPPDRYSGSSYINGTYKGVSFEASNVILEEEVEDEEEDEEGNIIETTEYETYFSGQWYIFYLNKNLEGILRLLPKIPTYRKAKYETESLEFNRAFKIIPSDKQFMFYILTPLMMEKILTLRSNEGTIYLAFQYNQLHIGVNNWQRKFPFNLNNSIQKESVERLKNDFKVVQWIIDEFKLDSYKFNETINDYLE